MLFQNNTNIELIQALISALLGGAGVALLQLIEKWISSKVDTTLTREERLYKESTTLRKELRDEVIRLESAITDLGERLNNWKTKYWALYEKHLEMSIELKSLKEEKEGVSTMENELEELREDRINGPTQSQ